MCPRRGKTYISGGGGEAGVSFTDQSVDAQFIMVPDLPNRPDPPTVVT
jgi:hypothetical protein